MLNGIGFTSNAKRASELAFATSVAVTPADKVKRPFAGYNRSHFEACAGWLDLLTGSSRISEQNRPYFKAKSQTTLFLHYPQRKALIFQWLYYAICRLPSSAKLATIFGAFSAFGTLGRAGMISVFSVSSAFGALGAVCTFGASGAFGADKRQG